MDNSSTLPLEAYNKSTPPGWKPGLPRYSWRRFLERMRLWYRLTDLNADQIGPAIAGHLVGRPYTLAMKLSVRAQDGQILRGDEALAYPGADPIADGMGVIQAAAAASGTQVLTRVLTGVYGSDDQADQWAKIKCFFRFRRNRVPLQDYLTEHDLCWDEATSAGFAMNNVGRSCFLLDNCGLPEQQLDNILLLTNHDLERYDEIRSHLDKIAADAARHQRLRRWSSPC